MLSSARQASIQESQRYCSIFLCTKTLLFTEQLRYRGISSFIASFFCLCTTFKVIGRRVVNTGTNVAVYLINPGSQILFLSPIPDLGSNNNKRGRGQ
jgi:hypothetical protein